jgi:uncharacterized protein YndB with AHSA1/START domain
VPTTRRRRKIPTSPEEVWRVVSDPHHLPRWWPLVARVEAVGGGRWTAVMTTSKGKPVRADYVLVDSEPPRHRRWAQELAGSPFERLLNEAVTDVVLEPVGQATDVRIELRQKPRGLARLGGLLLRRGARRRLDEALEGLERVCGR